MTIPLRLARGAVTGLILILHSTGIGLEWCGKRLVPLQKLLSKRIDGLR